MPLLTPGLHADEKSAALSIARNRASKVRMLRAEGLEDLALKCECSLYHDVLEHVCHHPYLGESFTAELAGTAVDCQPTDGERAAGKSST